MVEANPEPHQMTRSVLEVLAGVPLHRAAAHTGTEPADLADAVEIYQVAGAAALEAQARTHSWYQVRVQFTDWNTAEQTAATHLGPQLQQAENTGALAAWWFIRKAPCWRLRCRPHPATTSTDMQKAINTILHSLTSAGLIDRWWETVYEPETLAFGGPKATDIAHDLFHTDSRSILDYLRRRDPTAPPENTIGRRELSLLLCSTLFRSAGQEWYEQGDIWHRVAQLRPLPPGTPTNRLRDMTDGLRRLMTVDTSPTSTLFGPDGPLSFAAPWAAAFDKAGTSLGHTAQEDALERGVRDILAHHVIFHWNRLGLAGRTQAILARVRILSGEGR
jgi:thiopeptide-type bacteriocin biosynthesis protein